MLPDAYAREFAYLISQMDDAGYLTDQTPILVVQAPIGDRLNNYLSQNNYRCNAMVQAIRGLGDPRVRIVGVQGVPNVLDDTTDPKYAHWPDASVRLIGRERIYHAWQAAIARGEVAPVDPGLEASKDAAGFMGFGLRRVARIPAGETKTADIYSLNGTYDCEAGVTFDLPDLGKAALYTSAMTGGSVGVCVTLVPVAVGTLTISGTEEAPVAGAGVLYTNAAASALAVEIGPHDIYVPIVCRWTGTMWRVCQMGQSGSRQLRAAVWADLPSLAAGVPSGPTTTTVAGRPSVWRRLWRRLRRAGVRF